MVTKFMFLMGTSLDMRPSFEKRYFVTISCILVVIIWNCQGISLQSAASVALSPTASVVYPGRMHSLL